jgi:hypothetical protein
VRHALNGPACGAPPQRATTPRRANWARTRSINASSKGSTPGERRLHAEAHVLVEAEPVEGKDLDALDRPRLGDERPHWSPTGVLGRAGHQRHPKRHDEPSALSAGSL